MSEKLKVSIDGFGFNTVRGFFTAKVQHYLNLYPQGKFLCTPKVYTQFAKHLLREDNRESLIFGYIVLNGRGVITKLTIDKKEENEDE